MKFYRAISSVLAFFVAAMLVACGGGSNNNNNGGGGNPISVALSGTVPTSLAENASASLTAVVTNDSAAKGVTWSCTPSGACGSFSNTSTASGAATTYTAPGAIPTGGSVTVTATSVTDTTKSAPATIMITAPSGPTLSDGSYVFSLGGSDATPAPYFVAGVFTVKSGAITGGEQDFAACCNHATDMINPTGSSLSTTPSGNLEITLTTCTGTNCSSPDTTVGVAGVETFAASMVASGTSGRILEFDASASSSGTLDLQTSKSAPAGGYAFAVQGANSSILPLAIGGVINISGTSISTTTSAFDLNYAGNTFADQTFSAGTVSAPDASGRVVFSMTPSNTGIPQGVGLAGYIVDATHIRLVELTDALDSATGGTALGQNSANLSVSGNSYVLGLSGYDGNGVLQAAGVLTPASGATGVSGNVSYSDLAGGGIASPLTGGTYVADTTIPGRVTMTGVTDGNINVNLQVYVDGNGNALAITLDSGDVLEGVGYQQTGGGTFTAGSFSGNYVMDATGVDSVNELELDAVGPISADGSSKLTSPASTAFDLNSLTAGVPASNLTVSGTFTASGDGVFNPGTLTGLDVTTSTNADTFVYYLVDTTKVIAIEADPNQLTLAYLGQ
ncbi:MAG: hypothetical protein WAM79_21945 [Candidatus Sulfotelmatobacter sp.]